MPLSAGTRLGPYEILALIGSGGMGEVYKARDTRLDRLVAVKVSHERVSDRFAHEARAVAALNHPNIVALYDVGENYIVTELVEGESLRNAQLTPRRVLEVAAQVADGLAAAHALGIAHRDIKPENVMLARDGRAKILDFGLARHYAAGGPDDATRTLPGTVLGTVGYMSPEQVRGQDADHRSDVFSFGLMLYEMLSGRRAFAGDTSAEVMTAILKEDPPELPPSIPSARREIVRHCLEKDPEARFQSAKDLSFALRSQLTESGSTTAPPAIEATRSSHWLRYAVMAGAAGAAFALGWLANRKPDIDLAKYRFTPIASEAGPEEDPAWAPDGKSLAYSAAVGTYRQIFTRRLDSPVPDQITHESGTCSRPFWSRNGDRIFYSKGRQLWSIAAIGGAPQQVQDDVRAADIAPDGASMAVVRWNEELTFGRLGGHDWLPYRKPPFDGNLNARILNARILRFSPDGTKLAVLATRINSPMGEMWLIPFPPEKGSPRKLFPSEASSSAFTGFSWMPDSRNLVVALGSRDEPDQLYMGDSESGKLRKLTAGMESLLDPAVSPEGRRIAYVQQNRDSDVVEIMLENAAIRPVLTTARLEIAGSWLPNGREFIYLSNANGPFQLWARNPEDIRARTLLPPGSDLPQVGGYGRVALAPDGERLILEAAGAAEHTIWALRKSGGKAVRIDLENSDQHGAAWSPDGNWIAYGRVLPKAQLMKAPAGGGAPVPIATIERTQGQGPTSTAWSPTGEWIAWAADTLTLYSPDGKQNKKLGGAGFGWQVGFSRDGKTLYTYYIDRKERVWVLDSFDVGSGRQRRIGKIDLDFWAVLSGFGLHPEGNRFLATLTKRNSDIVLLEGF